ncbi:MAG: ABC transporter ATP-binding protein [Pseudomonadota bacterium]|nr:ABC transporter ATP-binding protein [Pseudomonadota bacterium]
MSEALIDARDLHRRYASGAEPVVVLQGLSLKLARGQSLALVGRSGSGKSTLLHLLCGLEKPDAGSLTVAGETFDAAEQGTADNERRWASLRRQALGVVFQDTNLMPTLSLLDNVRLRARLAGLHIEQCQDWLARLGIGELAGRYPDQVSGGQRQRAALAMTFAMSPALILADEPTGSLDRTTADQVADQLFQWQDRTGCGLVLATHDPELAARCDQVLDLGHGAQG